MPSSSRTSSILKGIQRFDLFGTPLQIRFNNVQMHKTYFGCLMTIIIFVLLIIYSYYVIVDCLTYARPNVVFQENSVELPSAFQLTPKTFSFAMGIQDQTNLIHFIDEKVYYLDVIFRETVKILNTVTNEYEQKDIQTPIKMVPCTPEHFQVEGTKEYFMKLKYNNLYCFPMEQQLILEGQFGAMTYRRLQIKVRYCVENCIDQDLLKKKLSNFAFQIYYVNYAIKSSDKSNPFQAIGQNTFWQNGYSLCKNVNIYFRKAKISSDFGLFIKDINQDARLLYSFDRETIITQTDNKMFEMYVNLEKNKESEYIRTYTKLYNGFSQIGGIYNILFCAGCIFCLPFSRSSLEKNLMNKIFNFKEVRQNQPINLNKNENDQNISIINNNQNLMRSHFPLQNLANQDSSNIMKINLMTEQIGNDKIVNKSVNLSLQQKDQRLKGLSQLIQTPEKQQTDFLEKSQQNQKLQNIISNETNQNSGLQQKIKNQDKIIQNNGQIPQKITNKLSNAYNSIKITIKNLIKSKLLIINRINQPYTKMINYGIDKLYSQLDVEYIMNKLLEIEKLKYLLLDENQIKLFEFIPKPTIYLSDFKNQNLQQKISKISSNQKNSCISDKNLTDPQPKFSLLTKENICPNQMSKEAEACLYQMLKIDKSSSRIDQKLIKLIDPDVIKLVQTNIRERTSILQRQDSPNLEIFQNSLNSTIEKQALGHNASIFDNELLMKDDDIDQETNENKSHIKYFPSHIKSFKLITKNIS